VGFRIAKNACLMTRRKSVFGSGAELSLDELTPAREASSRSKLLIGPVFLTISFCTRR
jgi:hypothetical protein